ncbi:MAG: hypothetical protein Q8L23_15015 [Caulobacter sp.]|nr:hypothetical protein [Caulobacter sp.]
MTLALLVSALLATATPEAALEPAFGATIVSTHPDGRKARLWLHRDHSYTAQGRKGQRSGGTWRLSKDGKLCLRQKRPLPIPVAYCRSPPTAQAGRPWKDTAFNGEPVVNEIVRAR